MDYSELQQKLDSSQMLARIDEFLPEFKKAFDLGFSFELPQEFKNAKHVVGLGMGGSGMAYTILKNLSRTFGTASIEVVSDYHLPPYIDQSIAVCATSFSGNTEETLSAAEEARAKGCPVVCVTTGGKLAAWATEHRLPLIQFEYPVAPRVGLPYTFGIALGVFVKAGFITFDQTEVENALLSITADYNNQLKSQGQKMAEELHGKMIYVVGAGFSYSAGVRWKGQFNENAKTIAFAEEMPEMCHNMYLGFVLPEVIRTDSAVIFLDSVHDHPQNRKRVELVGADLKQHGSTVIHPTFADALSPLATLLVQLVLGDYVSYYLALLNNVDPVEMERIEKLKKKL